MNIFSI